MAGVLTIGYHTRCAGMASIFLLVVFLTFIFDHVEYFHVDFYYVKFCIL